MKGIYETRETSRELIPDCVFRDIYENGQRTGYQICKHKKCESEEEKSIIYNRENRSQPAQRHHQKHHCVIKSQEKITNMGFVTRKVKISDNKKAQIVHATTKWCAATGASLSLPEHEATIQFHKMLICEVLGFDEETARRVKVTRYEIDKHMESYQKTIKDEIRELGPILAKQGKLSFMHDHWYCNRGSAEDSNSYHGILLCLTTSAGKTLYYPIRFQNAEEGKSNDVVEKELKETLEDYGLEYPASVGLVPVVTDHGLVSMTQNYTISHQSCLTHLTANFIKRAFDHPDKGRSVIDGYDGLHQDLTKFCYDANTWKNRQNPNCKKSFNSLINAEFPEKPKINRIFKVRFTSFADQVKNVLENESVIRPIINDGTINENFELVKDLEFWRGSQWQMLKDLNQDKI